MRDANPDTNETRKLSISLEALAFIESKRAIPPAVTEQFCETRGNKSGEILFHFRDATGATCYRKIFKLRSDGSRDPDNRPRRDRSGVATIPFNAECLALPSEDLTLIWTEGEFDTLGVITAGFDSVISVPDGAPAERPKGDTIDPLDDSGNFKFMWRGATLDPLLAQFNKHVLAVDADPPGGILFDELAIRLGREKCYFVTYPDGCKDPNDVLRKHGAAALREMIDDAKPVVPDYTAWIRDVKFTEVPQGRNLGIAGLNNHARPLDGDFIVISGPPGGGKSHLARVMCAGLSFHHHQFGTLLQFEDRDAEVRDSLANYYVGRMYEPREPISQELREQAKAWAGDMVRIRSFQAQFDDSIQNLEWLLDCIRIDVTRHGIKWFCIDPWNQLEHGWNPHQMTETQYLEHAFRSINRLRKELGVTMIIVAHPDKRGGRDTSFETFNLYDVSGGQHWNNAADIGLVVYRESETSPNALIRSCKVRGQAYRGKLGGGKWELNVDLMRYKHIETGVGPDASPVPTSEAFKI